MSQPAYTGRSRQRTTRRGVHVVDRLARWMIVAGGIGTIVAVSLVCVFLFWVVAPLFMPAKVKTEQASTPTWAQTEPLAIELSEDQLIGYAIEASGSLVSFRPDTGELIARQDFLRETPPTVMALDTSGQRAAFGFENGTVRLASLEFTTHFLNEAELPAELRELKVGQIAVHDEGVVLRTPVGQLRLEKLTAKLDPVIELAGTGAIRRIDYSARPNGEMFCVLSADGKLQLQAVERSENMMSDEVVLETTGSKLPLELPAGGALPDYVLLSDQGDHVFVAWQDGKLWHFDTRQFDQPRLAEKLDLVDEPEARLTACRFLLGKATILAGDSLGRVGAWFCVNPQEEGTGAPSQLVKAHSMAGSAAAVTCLAPSGNSRLFGVGYADHSLRMFYPTNERLILSARGPSEAPLERLSIAPRDNGLVALAGKQLVHWTIDPGYPETNFRSLFLPVWYEGSRSQSYVWQSSSGSAGAEPKLSLIPLIYGTLKATFYSLLFGVPLALCAALYTSEFMRPKLKAQIKPAIEMMASLPSVVLGFLAGAVVAPFVQHAVVTVMCSFFTIPFALLCGAYAWQLLPQRTTLVLARWRLILVFCMLPVGILLARAIAPVVERRWFADDISGWLDGQVGTGTGGWMFLLAPLMILVIAWLLLEKVNPYLRRRFHGWSRQAWTWVDLGNFLLGTLVVCMLTSLAAVGLDACGFDPRGQVPADLHSVQITAAGIVGTYVQRNALVVGFVMGFAVIPIIYTIADDALSMVPDHLRSASLGAGATPWQTAMRIVIPTAMSGLFSAVMIGLGRAVGETMIVLMAAGNTPIMDWNVFNGFQTLSSLIAQEMPDAVRSSTHYRTLFLAALTLFALTFVVNTVAEAIRLRFRRRAYEL